MVTAGSQINVLDDHVGEIAPKQSKNTHMWRSWAKS